LTELTTILKYDIADTAGVVGQQPYKAKAKFDELVRWEYIDKLNELNVFNFTVPNDQFHLANALMERRTFVPFITPFRGMICGRSSDESEINLEACEFAFHLTRRIFQHDGEKRVTYTKEDWYNSLWKYRREIVIPKDQIVDDVKDIPLLINLGADAGFKAHAQADGDDFVFTAKDGVTKIPHEIEKWDSSTGTLVAWVKIPTVSETSNITFYVYYGNAAATNQEDIINVWKNVYRIDTGTVITVFNYAGVWHLHDDSLDSTENNNDGTDTSITRATGQIADGASFNATTSKIDVASGSTIDDIFAGASTGGMVSGWFKANSDGEGDNGYIFDKIAWRVQVRNQVSNSLDLRFFRDWTGTDGIWDVTISNAINNLVHFVIIYDQSSTANVPHFIINGSHVTPTTVSTPTTAVVSDAANNGIIGNNTGQTATFDGVIDELRLMKSPPADHDHITTVEYKSQKTPLTFMVKFPQEQYERPANEIAQQILDSANADMPAGITWTLATGTPTTAVTGAFHMKDHWESLQDLGLIIGKDVWFDNQLYRVYIGTKGKTITEDLDITITSNPNVSTDNFANVLNLLGRKNNIGGQLEGLFSTSTVLRYNYEKVVADNHLNTDEQLSGVGNTLLSEFQKLTPQIKGEVPFSQFVRLNLQSGDVIPINQPEKQLQGDYRIMDITVSQPGKVKLALEKNDTAKVRVRSASFTDVIEGILKKLKDQSIES